MYNKIVSKHIIDKRVVENLKINIYPARVIFALLAVACMAVIFMFSQDNSSESSGKSGKVTETAVDVFVRDYKDMPPSKQHTIMDKAEHIVRKLAHYSIYTALGFTVSMAVGRRRFFSWKSLGVIAFCFLYACSDEIHQHFVPGRACMFTDILIDTGGALTGMLISFALLAFAGFITGKKAEQKIKAASPDSADR